MTHPVLIKDLATSQLLPGDLPLLEQGEGPHQRNGWDCVCRQPCGAEAEGEEARRETGQEGERDRNLPSLDLPSVAGTVLGMGNWGGGGTDLSGGGSGLVSRPL